MNQLSDKKSRNSAWNGCDEQLKECINRSLFVKKTRRKLMNPSNPNKMKNHS